MILISKYVIFATSNKSKLNSRILCSKITFKNIFIYNNFN